MSCGTFFFLNSRALTDDLSASCLLRVKLELEPKATLPVRPLFRLHLLLSCNKERHAEVTDHKSTINLPVTRLLLASITIPNLKSFLKGIGLAPNTSLLWHLSFPSFLSSFTQFCATHFHVATNLSHNLPKMRPEDLIQHFEYGPGHVFEVKLFCVDAERHSKPNENAPRHPLLGTRLSTARYRGSVLLGIGAAGLYFQVVGNPSSGAGSSGGGLGQQDSPCQIGFLEISGGVMWWMGPAARAWPAAKVAGRWLIQARNEVWEEKTVEIDGQQVVLPGQQVCTSRSIVVIVLTAIILGSSTFPSKFSNHGTAARKVTYLLTRKFYLVDVGYPLQREFIEPYLEMRYHISDFDW
ncbi:hypothetical protein M5K25_013862 [Dendrobium thyrsiflorum]|uniref:Uncharacterized protein n=1 Tax=Dendrobium thyrsiflorum TaxID=117978 RepID=A0ABD0UUU6_DENTH